MAASNVFPVYLMASWTFSSVLDQRSLTLSRTLSRKEDVFSSCNCCATCSSGMTKAVERAAKGRTVVNFMVDTDRSVTERMKVYRSKNVEWG